LRRRREALILSGGGADGAYGVGVVRALAEGRSPATGRRPLDPSVLSGTSVGSINAAALVAAWDGEEGGAAAARDLERFWLERLVGTPDGCSNGVFRFRADPFVYLDPRCFVGDPVGTLGRLARDGSFLAWLGLRSGAEVASTPGPVRQRLLRLFDLAALVSREPLRRNLEAAIAYAAIRDSPRQLLVTATNWASGELRLFTNRDFTDDLGPRLLMASSALPGFFSPAEVAGEPYVDGGVLMNTPLRPAIRAGADVLHVVYLDPGVSKVSVPRIGNVLEALYRTQLIAWAQAMNDDVEDARAVNDGLLVLYRARRGGAVEAAEARGMVHSLQQLTRVSNPFARYRPLTIHRYHPTDELGGALGLLDLDPGRIASLIRRGDEDGEHHDCAASGCVLPPPELLTAAQEMEQEG